MEIFISYLVIVLIVWGLVSLHRHFFGIKQDDSANADDNFSDSVDTFGEILQQRPQSNIEQAKLWLANREGWWDNFIKKMDS